jgi:hypothetical protein
MQKAKVVCIVFPPQPPSRKEIELQNILRESFADLNTWKESNAAVSTSI